MQTYANSQPFRLAPLKYRLYSLTACLLGIALPTSTALMNAALGLVVVCLLWQRDFRLLVSLVKKPIVWLPALMFVLLAVSLFSKHPDYGPKMLGKYGKLLYILPLALFFNADAKLKSRFINGFLLANMLILAISLAVGLGHIPLGHIDPQNPTVFKLQITQNVFLAFATLFWLAKAVARNGTRRACYATLAVLACANIMLMVQGRTGYVALLAGSLIWMFLTFRTRHRLAILSCGLLIATLLVVVPNRAAQRLSQGVEEVQQCLLASAQQAEQACNNSMGQRTSFIRESLHRIKQAPWRGNGAGGFFYSNTKTGYSINNPHNQYLLETVQSGLLGLVIFLTWMMFCLRAAWYQPLTWRNQLVALVGSYLACDVFNSFLLDSAEGHLFIVLAAILAVGVKIDKKKGQFPGPCYKTKT
ncbi:O-antigen biosynthesis protein [Serratia sp. Leaf50]|nr:O-antigen biosynthesis protein [Serratia sp. Leaf50]